MSYGFLIADNKKDTKDYIEIAINRQLFVKDWQLGYSLCRALTNLNKTFYNRPKYLIGLVTYRNLPIGVCLIEGKVINIYIEPDHRRKGLGSKLLLKMIGQFRLKNVIACVGIVGSVNFFQLLNITLYKDNNNETNRRRVKKEIRGIC